MKKYIQNKFSNTQSGQSLVEFAISLTVILYLLVGAVEFGIALFQYVQLRDAAQEGAIYGAINPGTENAAAIQKAEAAIRAHVRAASTSPIDLSDPSVVPDENITIEVTGGRCEGEAITVGINFDHRVFLPFISDLIGSNFIPVRVSVTDTVLLPLCPE